MTPGLVTSRIGIKKTFDVILENTVCQGKHSPKVQVRARGELGQVIVILQVPQAHYLCHVQGSYE